MGVGQRTMGPRTRRLGAFCLALALIGASVCAFAAVRLGLIGSTDPAAPATNLAIRMAAYREGSLKIYSNTSVGEDMIQGFRRRYPQIEVQYLNIGSQEIQRQV
ncbi:hypothetical protein LTR94_027869, partial [Friedmanniomyces endolithicus]